MLKKMMSVIMVLLLLSCFFITVLAGSVTPRYMYTSSILSDLNIRYKSSLTNAKSGLSNGTYRVKTVARVYVGENFEQNTVYSIKTNITNLF